MLQLLLKEQILTMAEYNAAEQRLASQQAQTASLQEKDNQEELKFALGTLDTVGRTIHLRQGLGVGQALGSLLTTALQMIKDDQADEIHLEPGRYHLDEGQGGVWEVCVPTSRTSNKPIVIQGMSLSLPDSYSSNQTNETGHNYVDQCCLEACIKVVRNGEGGAPNTTADDKTNVVFPLDPEPDDFDVVLSGLDISNPGLSGHRHESLQHGVLVDGIAGAISVSVQRCDIHGCEVEHGCGINVRHHGFCQVTKKTSIRNCYTGIQVDSMASVDCVDCQIYGHLASGLLITNSVRAEAYADLIGLTDLEKEEDGSEVESEEELTEEELKTKALSQQQIKGNPRYSRVGGCYPGSILPVITGVSGNGDCGIFVSDGGRLQLLKGANVFGNKNRGLVVEDDSTICEMHPMVAIHHNHAGATYFKEDDGSMLRSTRHNRKDDGTVEDIDAEWIEEPLQWWVKPKKLFKLLPEALMGSKKHQLELAMLYVNKSTTTVPQQQKKFDEWYNKNFSNVVVDGNKKPEHRLTLKQEKKMIVYNSVGNSWRWANAVISGRTSESTTGEIEIMKVAKKFMSKLKMMK